MTTLVLQPWSCKTILAWTHTVTLRQPWTCTATLEVYGNFDCTVVRIAPANMSARQVVQMYDNVLMLVYSFTISMFNKQTMKE